MLRERIQGDMTAADKRRLGVIRLMLAAIKQREVDKRIQLDDTQVLAVLAKMVKQRRDSLEQYRQANRSDLAEQEAYELTVIRDYHLPAALSDQELGALVQEAIAASGAVSMKDMAVLRPQVQGRADMGAVSALVKQGLGG
jgi:uncharacterized protein YqeY